MRRWQLTDNHPNLEVIKRVDNHPKKPQIKQIVVLALARSLALVHTVSQDLSGLVLPFANFKKKC
jgi:hypothetical protein